MDKALLAQAEETTSLLSRVMRLLFTVDGNDPGMFLPVAQTRVCTILREGPRTMSALSKDLATSLSAITQIADRLERAGLVERICDLSDRRVKSLALTLDGSELMRIRRENRTQRMCAALEHLSPEARTRVLDALQTLVDAGLASQPENPDSTVEDMHM